MKPTKLVGRKGQIHSSPRLCISSPTAILRHGSAPVLRHPRTFLFLECVYASAFIERLFIEWTGQIGLPIKARHLSNSWVSGSTPLSCTLSTKRNFSAPQDAVTSGCQRIASPTLRTCVMPSSARRPGLMACVKLPR